MSDSLGVFHIDRSTDGTTYTPDALPTVPGTGPYQQTDTTVPNPALFYKVRQTTANSVVVPYITATLNTVVSGHLNWAKYFQDGTTGSAVGVYASSVAVDSTGGAVVVGQFKTSTGNPVDFGLGPIYVPGNAQGVAACFIIKFNQAGTIQWFKAFASPGLTGDGITGVAIDSLDNIIVLGYSAGNIDVSAGLDPAIGQLTISHYGHDTEMFLAKYSPDGVLLWGFMPTNDGPITFDVSYADSIAVDGADNILFAFQCGSDTLHFNNGVSLSNTNKNSGSLAISKFSPGSTSEATKGTKGLCQWVKAYNGSSNTSDLAFPYCLRIDASGNPIVTGAAYGADANVGGGSANASGYLGAFVFKYSGTNGNALWSGPHIYASSGGNVQLRGCAFDPVSQRIYATGNLIGSTDFGGGSVSDSSGRPPLILVAFEAGGDWAWNQRVFLATSDTSLIAQGYSLAVDSNGYMALTGSYSGFMDLENDGVEDASGANYFIAALTLSQTPLPKHSPYLTLRWLKRNSAYPSGNGFNGYCVRLSGQFVIVTGQGSGNMDPGGIPDPVSVVGNVGFLTQYQR